MSRTALTWLVIMAGAAACAALAFNNTGIVAGAADSDMLWPATFVMDLTTRADGWRGHSLSRLPSLFPDLAVWVPLKLAIGSVRWTVFLYGVLQLSALVAVGGWIAARLAGRASVVGGAAIVAVLAVVVGVGLTNLGAGGMVRIAVLPIVHVGPLIMALLVAALTAGRLAAGRSVWPVAMVGAAVFLSDQLLLLEFVLPLLFASAVLGVAGRIRPSQIVAVVAWTAAGMALGAAMFDALRRAGVPADPAPQIHLRIVAHAIGLFFAGLPGLIAGAPVVIAVVGVAVLAFAALGRRLMRSRGAPPTVDRLFLWCFVGASSAGSIAFTACFYEDPASMRYLAGFWCCAIVVLGATLSLLPNASRAAGPLAAATLAILLGVFAIGDHGTVLMLRWRYDVAECVRQLRGPLDLHAGLGQYWVARPTEVALRFTTQIDQINDDGLAYAWNNDARWFRQSLADPARPPEYDFVALRNLDPARITARYGKPDLVVPCSNTVIWVFRDRTALYHRVTDGLPPTANPAR